MVSREDKVVVIYPEYFDITLTRTEGRRVPKKLAVNLPKLEDVAKAAKAVGLKPKIEEESAFPGKWQKKSGRILVPKKFKKEKIILKIATKMKKTKKA